MKNSPRVPVIRSKPLTALVAGCALAALSATASLASSEMDCRYSLDTVGSLKSLDNVDGLFADYIAQSIRDYFATQPRFLLQDLSRSDAVLSGSKLPYSKLIDDEQVLAKVARTTRSSTLIRTKIFKEGARYRFTIDWLHAPKMEAISSEVFFIDEPARGQALGAEEIKTQVQAALDRLIRKIPFLGHITGRDQSTVTLNVGDALGLRKGDTLVVGTLEEVKRHPLLKSIVEWRTLQTGKLEVDQVDRGITFTKILEEDPARPIARFNKLLTVIPKSDPIQSARTEPTDETQAPLPERTAPAKYGWISAGMLLGNASRQVSDATGTTGKDGGGYGGGARADAQIWLDRQWFAEGRLGFSYYPYSQSDLATGTDTGASSSVMLYEQKLGVGYSYLPGADFFGAKSWVKLGTQTFSFTLPKSAAEQTNPVKFSGLYLGLGGDLPLREGWGAQMNLDFGLTKTVTESSGLLGKATSATIVDFYAGTFKYLKPRLLFRMGFNFVAHGAEYPAGATLSHRTITVMPSWVMLF